MNFDIYNGTDTKRFVLGTKGNKTLIVIGINPSVADKDTPDKTISRVIKYSYRFGFDSFKMINIYPLRATNFNDLPDEFDSNLHNQNLIEIKREIQSASAILCAWGTHIFDKAYFQDCCKDIFEVVLSANLPIYCLGLTKKGHPLHPLLRGIPMPEKLKVFDMENYIFRLSYPAKKSDTTNKGESIYEKHCF